MDWNEHKRNATPIFVEPEMVEDMPLSRSQRLRERMKNIRRRIRLPQLSAVLTVAAVVLVLLALIAVPVLPGVALLVWLVKSCRPAFRTRAA